MSERAPRLLTYGAAILISISALGTSWAGYQSTVWGGRQTSFGGQSMAMRTKSTRASTMAGQLRIVDVGLFTNWLTAYGHGDTLLASFYRKRFRAEFVPAFNKWVASRPLKSPEAAPTPFALPEYRLTQDDDALRLEVAADSLLTEASKSAHARDSYVLVAVILAMVMFFVDTGQHIKSVRLAVVLMGIGVLIWCAGVFRLIMLPRV
jgi:hypothetical protein